MKNSSKGCFLSPVLIFLCLVLVAAACTVVGVAVYFAHPDKKSSSNYAVTTAAPIGPTAAPIGPTAAPSDRPLLPGTILPEHYYIILRPDIYRQNPEEFVFYGHVLIWVVVQEPCREITLHQRRLNIYDDSLSVRRTNRGNAVVRAIDFEREKRARHTYFVRHWDLLRALRTGQSTRDLHFSMNRNCMATARSGTEPGTFRVPWARGQVHQSQSLYCDVRWPLCARV